MSYHFRSIKPEDLAAVGALVAEGFETYRSLAPAGWRLPDQPRHVEAIEAQLATAGARSMLACSGRQVAGHVMFLPASAAMIPSAEPNLAHLSQLFVRRSDWGTGLARTLLADAQATAWQRGFSSRRLFTPSGQLRARRLDERAGWTPGEQVQDPRLGIPLVQYRIARER